MNIIHIEKPPPKLRDTDWDNWKAQANAKLGRPAEDYYYSGNGPWDFVFVDGRMFKREADQKFFYCEQGHHRSEAADHYPDIICGCGSDKFQAAYGSYSLILKCLSCGQEECVYSG